MNKEALKSAIEKIRQAKHITVFTGAGISVGSGIPPFRGENGLWSKYDPIVLDLTFFHENPKESWQVIKEIFYDFFGQAKANAGHIALAEMEKMGFLQTIITQNIDNLHQEAGNSKVIEFHGTSHTLVCEKCKKKYFAETIDFSNMPPKCKICGTVLKPDFIFFGEPIPKNAFLDSLNETKIANIFFLIGTTGEIMPASTIPSMAKDNGAVIIEINPVSSNFTHSITDIFLQGKAEKILPLMIDYLKNV